MRDKRLIAIDFDGVLTTNLSDWQGFGIIPDGPNDGAIPWLLGLLLDSRFDVVIHSSRGNAPEGVAAMMTWLVKHGVDRSLLEKIEFSSKKPPAKVFLDDHGMQFRGAWPTYDELANFIPWRPKSAPERRSPPTDVNYCEAESDGEIELIWRREHKCLSCMHKPVCTVAKAIEQVEMVSAITRCLGYLESFMPDIE